jgi:two-component system, chemotaxis family, CheB/CheR fusion protein
LAGRGLPRVDGPHVPLGFEQVQTLALALHELATNAMKHGALKQENGHLDVSRSVQKDAHGEKAVLDWRESGVPGLTRAAMKGFGRELIEQALSFTLHANVALKFGTDGLSCHIELPLVHRAPLFEVSQAGGE